MGWAKYNEDDREICEDRWTMRETDVLRRETQQTSFQWKYSIPERKATFKEKRTGRA